MDRFTLKSLNIAVVVSLLRLLYFVQRQIFDLGLRGSLKKPSKVGALMRQVRWKIVKLVLLVERWLTLDMQLKESDRHEKKWAKSLKRKK